MAIDSQYPFGCEDAKVYKITALGTPTYGSGVDLNAVQDIEFGATIQAAILRGDDVIKVHHAIVDGGEFKIKCGGIDLAGFEPITGATASDSGTTPNERTWLDIKTNQVLPYLGFIAQAVDGEATLGDTSIVAFKAKAEKLPPIAFGDGNFATVEFSGKVLASPYDNVTVLRIINHETAVTIPTTWPGNQMW
jgi:hypothetical protein